MCRDGYASERLAKPPVVIVISLDRSPVERPRPLSGSGSQILELAMFAASAVLVSDKEELRR